MFLKEQRNQKNESLWTTVYNCIPGAIFNTILTHNLLFVYPKGLCERQISTYLYRSVTESLSDLRFKRNLYGIFNGCVRQCFNITESTNKISAVRMRVLLGRPDRVCKCLRGIAIRIFYRLIVKSACPGDKTNTHYTDYKQNLLGLFFNFTIVFIDFAD